jgi:hypothetical protein
VKRNLPDLRQSAPPQGRVVPLDPVCIGKPRHWSKNRAVERAPCPATAERKDFPFGGKATATPTIAGAGRGCASEREREQRPKGKRSHAAVGRHRSPAGHRPAPDLRPRSRRVCGREAEEEGRCRGAARRPSPATRRRRAAPRATGARSPRAAARDGQSSEKVRLGFPSQPSGVFCPSDLPAGPSD